MMTVESKDTSEQMTSHYKQYKGHFFCPILLLNDPSTKDTSIKKSDNIAGPNANGFRYQGVPLYH